jgi:hypothetical protein
LDIASPLASLARSEARPADWFLASLSGVDEGVRVPGYALLSCLFSPVISILDAGIGGGKTSARRCGTARETAVVGIFHAAEDAGQRVLAWQARGAAFIERVPLALFDGVKSRIATMLDL